MGWFLRNLLLLERLHVGHIFHFLSVLVTAIWTALVRLLRLLGRLRQDLTGSPAQPIGAEGVRNGARRRFRRRRGGRVIGCQLRWRSRYATCQQAQSDERDEISIHG